MCEEIKTQLLKVSQWPQIKFLLIQQYLRRLSIYKTRRHNYQRSKEGPVTWTTVSTVLSQEDFRHLQV